MNGFFLLPHEISSEPTHLYIHFLGVKIDEIQKSEGFSLALTKENGETL